MFTHFNKLHFFFFFLLDRPELTNIDWSFSVYNPLLFYGNIVINGALISLIFYRLYTL